AKVVNLHRIPPLAGAFEVGPPLRQSACIGLDRVRLESALPPVFEVGLDRLHDRQRLRDHGPRARTVKHHTLSRRHSNRLSGCEATPTPPNPREPARRVEDVSDTTEQHQITLPTTSRIQPKRRLSMMSAPSESGY